MGDGQLPELLLEHPGRLGLLLEPQAGHLLQQLVPLAGDRLEPLAQRRRHLLGPQALAHRSQRRPEQAVDAWSKVYAFFGRHLQPGAEAGGPQRWIGASPNVSLSGKVPLRPS